MPQIIAGVYEIVKEIGSGGGGFVYLAKHLRLGKWVVLKADKRTLSAKPEALRREVDALKDLSNTYIPRVYDFVAENGTVYTVMDYIEGESLDKPLSRGERFSQPRTIKWARQLLNALCYLHSRPPYGILHGDIKPSNIMLTPQGDICLIDFNIALALGEEGAVQVGKSAGYASPEHYGIDYIQGDGVSDEDPSTKISANVETVLPGESSQSGDSSDMQKKPVRVDVRSDIYGLGATLYHLLSGVRPARNAKEVAPLSPRAFSPAVIAIIQKAMEPDPARRYQTAEEMLYALEHLWENDPRTKRRRRRICAVTALLAGIFLLGGGAAFTGLKQMEQRQSAYALAEYAQSALRKGDVQGAVHYALEAMPEEKTIFSAGEIPQAQKALTDALGVYDLSDGLKSHLTVELPSEALKVTLSPDGTRLAALYAYRIMVVDTETGEQLADLPAQPTAAADLCFLNENALVYAGESGLSAYDIGAGKQLWCGQAATHLALSADNGRVVGVYGAESHATVYDAATGAAVQTVDFSGRSQHVLPGGGILADPEDSLLALNGDGSLLAVSFEGGGLSLYDLVSGEDAEIFDTSAFTHFEGGFYKQYFAFSAWNTTECIFAVVDTQTMEQTGGFSAQTPFQLQVDDRGICVASENVLVQIDPVTGERKELAYTSADMLKFARGGGHTLASIGGGAYFLFDDDAQIIAQGERETGCELLGIAGPYAVLASRETPVVQILKLESHSEALLLSYDPSYPHAEARLSADGKTVMLFQYDRFYLLSREGELIARTDIPDAMRVYDQQYRREGGESRLEVIYEDGTVRAYSATDGSVLWERQGEKPDESLEESFELSQWRIKAPLHETPVVYDKRTGKPYKELEKDSYLTYVTETGDYMITQYLSGQGERYGLLLNRDFETLAYLPGLCDVVGETLVFDDDLGNLRQSRIYSLQELKALAKIK
ncbi:protein kinase domain-containing protein [Anaeromassilibacillus senegalensis]|uniref:serine/threonine-protein kinase n=1 Tax=Anaeromassilibacillus senegalensis TaxID=1673717 RepID=UPI00068164B5|nr:serine/threonine-protein kinase [Anaeromassilibacillus senegalensis]